MPLMPQPCSLPDGVGRIAHLRARAKIYHQLGNAFPYVVCRRADWCAVHVPVPGPGGQQVRVTLKRQGILRTERVLRIYQAAAASWT
jgi:hypothetical protein